MVAAAAWAGVALAGASAASQSDASRRASNAARDGAATADPAAWMRPGFQDKLIGSWDKLSTFDPEAILKNPEYQFMKTEGSRGIAQTNAATFGSNRNGTYGEDMASFGTGLASTFIDKQFNKNMAMLGLMGNFSGLTAGNPGMSGSLIAQGGQNNVGNENNMWGQIGGGMQLFRNMQGGGGTATPMFSYTGYDSAGGPAYG